MFKEFKEFALKGNVVDLAVAVVIGAAFGKIVSSLVVNIFTPLLGLLVAGVNFSNLKIILKEATDTNKVISIDYGIFLQNVFDFTIVAFAIFLMVKSLRSLKKKEEAIPTPPPAPTKEELLLSEIRDLLKNK